MGTALFVGPAMVGGGVGRRDGYPFAEVEAKWQARWEREKPFRALPDMSLPKYYVLDMFPYPSGSGLHVGHPEGYVASDIVARFKRMRGFNVLHPMGWDAFGLPTENYAIQTGRPPAEITRENCDNFRRQLKRIGFSYDWEREVNTSDPGYYRWTQWIFLRLLQKGLAYQAEAPINWCGKCKTGLANEEAQGGVCERCGGPVEKRRLRQWMLKITAYAERLLNDLEGLDWPAGTLQMQREWIGRSEGAEILFPTEGAGSIRVFTTRPDTIFGATYMVVAPEHDLVDRLASPGQRQDVRAYREAAARKSDLERTDLAKKKTGVDTGGFAVNPATGKRIPVWVSDYVLSTYGTGAIMAVPGHDARDWEFARAFGLPVVEVVSGGDPGKGAYEGEGRLVNSGPFDGLPSAEAKRKIVEHLAAKGLAEPKVHFKLRDWVFSRQRYWGEPFPVLHREDGTVAPLAESDLPLRLPEVERYEPSGTGESPLAALPSWVETRDPATGRPARRETNTMPNWAGSCWYYLRFVDPGNDRAAWDPAKEKYWMPVDLYVGGSEHAVLHLLYARFWHKVLYDLGLVSTKEPFARLFHQGQILGPDGERMSKSRGNVISVDTVLAEHGADVLRLFEMFLGPVEVVKPWNTQGIGGVRRFADRVWRLAVDEDGRSRPLSDGALPEDLDRLLHQTIRKVTEDVEGMRFNTAISQMMVLVNRLGQEEPPPRAALDVLARLLAPFAPHLAEEVWERLGHAGGIARAPWPVHDEARATEAQVTVVVQIDGKLRGELKVPRGTPREPLEAAARAVPNVAEHLRGRAVAKAVVLPDRLVNFVLRRDGGGEAS